MSALMELQIASKCDADMTFERAVFLGCEQGGQDYLCQVWHDATEHPATDDDILIEHEDGFTVGWYGNTYHDEGGFVVKKPIRWAYVNDLTPNK